MYYRKRLRVPSSRGYRLTYTGFALNMDDDESGLNARQTPLRENLISMGSVLAEGRGVLPLELLGGIPAYEGETGRLFYYRRYDHERDCPDDRLAVYISGQPIRYFPLYGQPAERTLEYTPFSRPPSGINYRLDGEDVLLLSSADDRLAVWNGDRGVEPVPDAPRINSMCMHYERLFATDAGEGTSLWFSDDLDPRNWDVSLDEAGFIEMTGIKGRLLAVVSFLDYVYVFRSYGISRLSAFGDQTQFAAHELFTSMGRIFPESIQPAGDRLLFLARDGLYAFDGLDARRLNLGVGRLLENAGLENMASCFFEGKYYLAFATGGAGANDSLLEYDVNRGEVNLYKGLNVVSMVPLLLDGYTALAVLVFEGGLLRVGKLAEGGECLGRELPKRYCTPLSDFGAPGRRKLLKNLRLFTDTRLEVTVETDGTPRRFFAEGGEGNARLPIELTCDRCRLIFEPKGKGARIGGIELELEVIAP